MLWNPACAVFIGVSRHVLLLQSLADTCAKEGIEQSKNGAAEQHTERTEQTAADQYRNDDPQTA